MIAEHAPAKINLYLHVGPVRSDGLHDLTSLFVFTERGDVVYVAPADDLSLTIEGPFAAALADEDPSTNLVILAANALKAHADVEAGAAIALEKNLPVAAGVGGGSADAAAALRALVQLWRIDIDEEDLRNLAFSLGADIPACLSAAPVNVSGAGERLAPGPALPPLWACLVNPGVETPTGPIFRAFDEENPAPPTPITPNLPDEPTFEDVAALFAVTRNDLEAHAVARAPLIADTLSILAESPGALGARMSGSGATCFALFTSATDAAACLQRCEDRGYWAFASPLAR